MFHLYSRLNVLSLDVAAGAVCSSLFFAKLLDVNILPYGLLSLAMSVWIIYTIDHLLDAKKIVAPASTERHRFHQRNFKALCWIVSLAVVINVVVIMFVRPAVLKGGVILIICCGLYLLAHRFVRFPKELLVAVLYTAGVILPSLSVTTRPVDQLPFVAIVQFMLTALLNLIIFSWYDRHRDKADGSSSIVLLLGETKSMFLIRIIPLVNIALSVFGNEFFPVVIIVAMNLILVFVFIGRSVLLKDDRFRLIGDAVFLLPLLYYLI